MKTRLSACCAVPREGPSHLHPLLFEPDIELARVEPHELANFKERNPPFGHEASHMPVRHSQSLGDPVDIEQCVTSVCPRN
jgi:hypothetical protein